jgi:hypothetical protein
MTTSSDSRIVVPAIIRKEAKICLKRLTENLGAVAMNVLVLSRGGHCGTTRYCIPTVPG